MSNWVLEICAGAGGQAIGLEKAGFRLSAAIEIEREACNTLQSNRPGWKVLNSDVRNIEGRDFRGIDLFAGGVPCPPFSIAGKQRGQEDERDLFPEALRLIESSRPRAFMLENVRGFASNKFKDYRLGLFRKFEQLGFSVAWRILNASDYGVPQLRPRFVLVGLKHKYFEYFEWPKPVQQQITVADAIYDLIKARRWKGAKIWRHKSQKIAPTLVGGSKKHGGPDLGPTRAKQQWKELGVDGKGLAEHPPEEDFPVDGLPRLTVRMTARIQGFPDEWQFSGSKTASYRQVGNAFPPPVAAMVAASIVRAWNKTAVQEKDTSRKNIFALAGKAV